MGSDTDMEMDRESPDVKSSQPVPFQLQFDKRIPYQVKFAEWNPKKDLLAMVTEDSKILLHRFNWQRPWTVLPGRCVTSLCWRPDGKAITVGLEDGSIVLYDVENGKLLRTIRSHSASVISLCWEEDMQNMEDDGNIPLTYEDRTMRFFPRPPRIPQMPGLSSEDVGFVNDLDDSLCELSFSPRHHLNILCSGDKAGYICFNIFGMFPLGKINVHELSVNAFGDKQDMYHLMNASVQKVALSKNLSQLIILTFGALTKISVTASLISHVHKDTPLDQSVPKDESLVGLHSLVLDTSIFCKRKKEICQVALQASNIEDLVEVSRASISVMHKQWSDAMYTFHEKFDPLSSLITEYGLDSSAGEEFLSLLFGARTSNALHQFLVKTLRESGLKHVSKTIIGAGKELHLVVREHLQPAAEIIGFRTGELRSLSRWRARYHAIGLDEELIDKATEMAGMFLVHVERFSRVLAVVLYLFRNFFNWLFKCTRLLMSEPIDQVAHCNSEHVVLFLRFHLNNDLITQLLESSLENIEIDQGTMQRVKELAEFGGFSDVKFLTRSLITQFRKLEHSLKEVFSKPLFSTSKKILCDGVLPLFPSASFVHVPTSISFSKNSNGHRLVDYFCFKIPGRIFGLENSIGVAKGLTSCKGLLEVVVLSLPNEYKCIDLAFYKENQIVLLLNEAITSSESLGKAWMAMISTSDLPFSLLSSSAPLQIWKLDELKESSVEFNLKDGKMRSIPHLGTFPLAVSASRGVTCVFALRKRVLLYVMDENEENSEMD